MKKDISISMIFMLLAFNSIAQTWQWAVAPGSSNVFNGGNAICVDGSGNSYSTGSYGYNIIFNTAIGMIGNGSRALYTAKYDVNGNCLWVKDGESQVDNLNGGMGITMDKQGNILETGNFTGNIYFDTNHLHDSAKVPAMYVVKYNSSGGVLWARGSHFASTNTIATDSKGNVYVSGCGYEDTIDTVKVSGSAWILKFNSGGKCVWGKSLGSTGVWISALAADSIGNIFVCGYDTGIVVVAPGDTLKGGKNGGGFISKLDSNRNVLWIKTPKWAPASNSMGSIGIDKSDNCYLLGNSSGKISFGADTLNTDTSSCFVIKYRNNGNLAWDKLISKAWAGQLAVAKKGDCFISLSYRGNTTIGSCSITGNPGMFTAALDSTGGCIAYHTASGNILANAMALDPSGNCYLTGIVSGNCTFDANLLNISGNNESIFIAKLSSLTSGSGDREQNPNSSIFNVFTTSSGKYDVQISPNLLNSNMYVYDGTGRLIFQIKLGTQSQIEIPLLNKGTYTVQLNTPDGHSMQRSLVKNQ